MSSNLKVVFVRMHMSRITNEMNFMHGESQPEHTARPRVPSGNFHVRSQHSSRNFEAPRPQLSKRTVFSVQGVTSAATYGVGTPKSRGSASGRHTRAHRMEERTPSGSE